MVKAWKEKVAIPTYEPGLPEKNPIFLEKRVYQGSSGVVYPYPVIESISDTKTMREWNGVWLENEYIKVLILPELGGRVQMAYDKIAGRHFVYYNHVIKPALVGLAGPWISGGIEFNWPQHHRPSTFMEVDADIEEHPDGSVTVWVNEMERMTRQKGAAGFTLRPGHAYLEIRGRVSNRSEMPQTFLWWANPAVAVNDHYQSVFPPDINAVFDHGKRAVSTFPIATGTYYKMDYSAGVDISNYKNIKVPTSYMAVNSRFNFEGGYENDSRAGMLHVASHHVSPGKKQWTWGNGDFGRAWDRNLTDEDGPYIELMAGVYTENQPDFTWLQPYEEKSFVQYFLPYRELGVVKNASKDILLNIDPVDGADEALVRLFATSAMKVSLSMMAGATMLAQRVLDMSPEKVCGLRLPLGGHSMDEIRLELRSASGRLLLDWEAEPSEPRPVPDAAEAALLPEEIKTCEQLFLTGLHLEQYRHATYNPTDYYREALRRDPDDVRNNNALGLWYIRKGRPELALPYLEKAVKVLQRRNPNPYDGEPIYNLGLALKYLGRFGEAYDRFYKSTWNAAWQDAGYLACAQISLMQGRPEDALDEVERSLVRNWHNHKARALKATVLRHLGRDAEALAWIEDSLAIDRFNYGALFEKWLMTGDAETESTICRLMHGEPNNYDETAFDYVAAGAWSEADAVWRMARRHGAFTYLSAVGDAFARSRGSLPEAEEAWREAEAMSADYCFANRLDSIAPLRMAADKCPADAKPLLCLGNLFYDKRQYDLAVEAWEEASRRDPECPMVWRNLALAAFNKQADREKAVEYMERAFSLDTSDARILMELDQLHKRLGAPHASRLARLEAFPQLVESRDDLLLEKATLLNLLGRHREAMEVIDSHVFHPWEGGEGKVPGQYQFARVELAKQALAAGMPAGAVELLKECLVYPHHLGEGKLHGAQENDFHYFLGVAYDMLGDVEAARRHWELATEGPQEPAAALYYNDARPDKIFYQGLALRALGREEEARSRFNRLVAYGDKHIWDDVKMDYFAVSLPDLQIWDGDLNERNAIHCHYMRALGHLGLGDAAKSALYASRAAELDANHDGLAALAGWRELAAAIESGKVAQSAVNV